MKKLIADNVIKSNRQYYPGDVMDVPEDEANKLVADGNAYWEEVQEERVKANVEVGKPLVLETQDGQPLDASDIKPGTPIIEDTITLSEVLGDSTPGDILQGMRAREDLSQKALSDKTGIPVRTISQYENDKKPITEDDAKKFASAIGTDYKVFL